MRPVALAICVALGAWCASAEGASILFASTNESPGPVSSEFIFGINQMSGAAFPVGDSAFNSPLDLASDGALRLWACNTLSNQLVSIDPVTGEGTPVGAFGTAFAIQSIAFDISSGRMFGTTSIDQLYEINPVTGQAFDFVGNVDASALLGLGFDLAGTLYGVSDQTGQLVTINTDTAVATSLGPTGVNEITDLAFRDDGVLFAASSFTDSIYTLDPSNGAATLVGPYDTAQDVSFVVGLAFVVPEPATLALLTLGSLALFRRRR